MKTATAILVLLILVLAAVDLMASGPVGIYGIVEKVIFEPNQNSPERIQVWGAFAFVDGGVNGSGRISQPQRGYLYFTLPSGNTQAAPVRAEWSDLKAIAGTEQAIGFGNWGYIGAFDGLALRTNKSSGQPPYFISSEPRPSEDAGAIGGYVHSSFGIDDSSTVKRILSWIDSLKPSEMFFVTFLPVAGHHPYATPTPGPFALAGGNDEMTRYLDALHYGDEALGEFLNELRTRGLDEKTLFVLFGDHGEAFGQHDGNFGHTLFIYDENVHVPDVIAAPGLIRNQLRVPKAVSLIDTAPTILDLLGLPIPTEYQGRSMLDPQPKMSLFFTDYSLGLLGLYDACWKYIFETNSKRFKLYDVCKDPEELNDLSAPMPGRVSAYRSRLLEWISAQHE